MPKTIISNRGYTYCHDDGQNPCENIDIHDIFITKSKVQTLLTYLNISVLVVCFHYLLILKEKLFAWPLWFVLPCALYVSSRLLKHAKKESVVIMPTLGVQLETHYWSGRVTRRFISIGEIVKPVLNECVTPVTCYWSLALILCDENELMLVFQVYRPPLKMLVPVWEALCSLLDCKKISS